jgi:hypothetical protein
MSIFLLSSKHKSLGKSPWESPFGEVVEGTKERWLAAFFSCELAVLWAQIVSPGAHTLDLPGMENAEQFYSYGDMPPWGKGPKQGPI